MGEINSYSLEFKSKLELEINEILQFLLFQGCIQLAISTNNYTIVRVALILAEGIFETGETFARHPAPSHLRSLLHMPLRPPRDVPVDIHIKVCKSPYQTLLLGIYRN